jgi:predicted membrane-bound mannosyltransferase
MAIKIYWKLVSIIKYKQMLRQLWAGTDMTYNQILPTLITANWKVGAVSCQEKEEHAKQDKYW